MKTRLTEKTCYVCLRVTPEVVLKMAHEIWSEDPEIARSIGLEASKIIEEKYHENPYFFCSQSAKGLLSGLFYILSFKEDKRRKTQKEIPETLSIPLNGATLRKHYIRWMKTFPELGKIINDYYSCSRLNFRKNAHYART